MSEMAKAKRGEIAVVHTTHTVTPLVGKRTVSDSFRFVRVTRVGRDGAVKAWRPVGSQVEQKPAYVTGYKGIFVLNGRALDVEGCLAALLTERACEPFATFGEAQMFAKRFLR